MRRRETRSQDFPLIALGFACGLPTLFAGCQQSPDDGYRTVSAADVADLNNGDDAGSAIDSALPRPEVEGGLQLEVIEPETTLDRTNEQDLLRDHGLSPEDVGSRTRIKLLVPERSFSVEGGQQALRVSFDDFDLERVLNVIVPPPDVVEHFPDWLSSLDGRRVRVRGFMVPAYREEGLVTFVLARDTECCFGANGKIYHLVEVALTDGVTTEYIHRHPFDVEGVFHIRPDAEDGELWQLYQIDDAVIIDR